MDSLIGRPEILVPAGSLGGALSGGIVDILMHPSIRRGSSAIYREAINDCGTRISKFVEKDKPIEFVFQGFPFKCHNPFETLRRTPDLGELAFLKRLLDINETIKQLYSPGVKFTVLTEGKSYKDLFGASDKEIALFTKVCREFCRKLKAEKIVNFVDFMDLLDDPQRFSTLCTIEEGRLRDRQSSGFMDEEVEQFISVMMRSLPYIQDVTYKDLLSVFGKNKALTALSDNQLELLEALSNDAKELAIRYLAIQKAKGDLNVIGSKYPDYIYVSTTAKRNRYSFHPIHRRTRLYPHHGVPVFGSDKVDVVFLGEVISNSDKYTAVYCDDDIEDAPFCFLKGKQHIKKKNLCNNRKEVKKT